MDTGTLWTRQAWNILHETCMRVLPSLTAAMSEALVNVLRPNGSASERRAGGPRPTPRMRENGEQGVPMCMPRIKPALIQPSISDTLPGRVKSCAGPMAMSHFNVIAPSAASAEARCPDPLNSSKKTRQVKEMPAASAGHRRRRRWHLRMQWRGPAPLA